MVDAVNNSRAISGLFLDWHEQFDFRRTEFTWAEIRIEAELVNLGVYPYGQFSFRTEATVFALTIKALPEQKLRVAKDLKDYLQGEIYREMISKEAEIKARDSSKLA